MKINNEFATNMLGLLTTAAIRGWMGSLEFKLAAYDPAIDPVDPRLRTVRRFIFSGMSTFSARSICAAIAI